MKLYFANVRFHPKRYVMNDIIKSLGAELCSHKQTLMTSEEDAQKSRTNALSCVSVYDEKFLIFNLWEKIPKDRQDIDTLVARATTGLSKGSAEESRVAPGVTPRTITEGTDKPRTLKFLKCALQYQQKKNTVVRRRTKLTVAWSLA